MPLITVVGTGSKFSFHKAYASQSIVMLIDGWHNCICSAAGGIINGVPFNGGCLPKPLGDLIAQRNSSCAAESYAGGLQCC